MNIHQKMVIFFETTMKAYSKAVMFSLKILGRYFRSFTDIKNNEVSLILLVHQNIFELTPICMNELHAKSIKLYLNSPQYSSI